MKVETSTRDSKAMDHVRRFGVLPLASSVATSKPPQDARSDPPEHESMLLQDVRGGDTSAFRALYARYYDTVLGWCERRGCVRDDAEDIAHDVFLSLWRNPPRLERARLATWLYRVTANRVASHHRWLSVRRRFARRTVDPAIFEADSQLAEQQLAREILSRLRATKREVLVLFELEGLSGDEIAERLGIRINTVWTRLHYARRDFLEIARALGVRDVRWEEGA